jgi:trans-aconitate methyltransferase
MTWQAQWVRKQAIFGGAQRILEIGAGAFDTSIYLANKHPDKEFYALDFVLSKAALDKIRNSPKNLHIIKSDATNLRLFSEGYFDLCFSVAVTEHIPEMETHLSEVYRTLRVGGVYSFWQAPFWSCSMGHHYIHSNANCPIPPYAHLYLDRKELGNLLSSNGHNADEILKRVYDRYDLSRHTFSQVKDIVSHSDFDFKNWEVDTDGNYNFEAAKLVKKNNIYSVSDDDLRIKGAKFVLIK